MYSRRFATFLIGAWTACTALMGYVAIENYRAPALVMQAPPQAAAAVIEQLGRDRIQLLLRHLTAEQTRMYIATWEVMQLPLALALAGCVFLGVQRRVFPLVLCGLLLCLVLFERMGVTPELTFSGREADFPPGSETVDLLSRVRSLQQVYIGVEAVKLLVSGVLTAYLFTFKPRRSRRDPDPVPTLHSTRTST